MYVCVWERCCGSLAIANPNMYMCRMERKRVDADPNIHLHEPNIYGIVHINIGGTDGCLGWMVCNR